MHANALLSRLGPQPMETTRGLIRTERKKKIKEGKLQNFIDKFPAACIHGKPENTGFSAAPFSGKPEITGFPHLFLAENQKVQEFHRFHLQESGFFNFSAT